MKHKIDYLSEFEQEFELDDDSMYENANLDNSEIESEYEDDYEIESEDEYMEDEFEFEGGDEYDDSEFEYYDEQPSFEDRLYEVYSGTYESELEFENDLNRVLHEMEQDFFFKKIGRFVKKVAKNPVIKGLAKKALNAIPGKYGDLIRNGLKNPREFLKSAIKTLGPQLANAVIPGSGIALNALMGEMETEDAQRAAARSTVAFANEVYENYANELNEMNLSRNTAQAKNQLINAAKKSVKKAYHAVRLGSKDQKFKRVNRKVEDIRIQGVPGKKVTIIYKAI